MQLRSCRWCRSLKATPANHSGRNELRRNYVCARHFHPISEIRNSLGSHQQGQTQVPCTPFQESQLTKDNVQTEALTKDHEAMSGTQPMPESCRTCTEYLNQTLPKQSCYMRCPKNSPTEELENSLSHNVNPTKPLEICPKCERECLYWDKSQLMYECLVCKRTYTVKGLEIARVNAENEKKYPGYLPGDS